MADRSPGLFDADARLAEISAKGDGLERIAALVEFEVCRPTLEVAVPRRDRSRRTSALRSCPHAQGSHPASHALAV